MCLFNKRCRLKVLEHRLQQNFEPFLVVSAGSGVVFTDTIVEGATEVLLLSGSGVLISIAGGGGGKVS